MLEPKGLGWRVAELWPFEIFQYVWIGHESVVRSVGRSVGRSSIYTSYTDLITPLSRYVRNVAREE